jgi:hypothetical protein
VGVEANGIAVIFKVPPDQKSAAVLLKTLGDWGGLVIFCCLSYFPTSCVWTWCLVETLLYYMVLTSVLRKRHLMLSMQHEEIVRNQKFGTQVHISVGEPGSQ